MSPLKWISEPAVDRTPSAATDVVIVLFPVTVITEAVPAKSTTDPSELVLTRAASRSPLTVSVLFARPAIARPLLKPPPLTVRPLVAIAPALMSTPLALPVVLAVTSGAVRFKVPPPDAAMAVPARMKVSPS